MKLQRGQLGLDQTVEVDRRLVAARTLAKFRGQSGPLRRAGLTAVFPMRGGGEGGGQSNRAAANRDFLIMHPYLD